MTIYKNKELLIKMMSILQTNNNKNLYYKLGYIAPFTPVKPLCYPDLTCATKNFSMCRFPNTKWNARLYYDRPYVRIKPDYAGFKNCECRLNQCDKYLFNI
jgi:hypothetical protein